MMTDNEAREIINREIDKACDDESYMTDEVYDALCVASKVLALGVCSQSKWIPVGERLPEENIHVLCQFYMGGMAECYYAHNYWHIVGGYRIKIDEVIAWMPLPEPYEAESEE